MTARIVRFMGKTQGAGAVQTPASIATEGTAAAIVAPKGLTPAPLATDHASVLIFAARVHCDPRTALRILESGNPDVVRNRVIRESATRVLAEMAVSNGAHEGAQ